MAAGLGRTETCVYSQHSQVPHKESDVRLAPQLLAAQGVVHMLRCISQKQVRLPCVSYQRMLENAYFFFFNDCAFFQEDGGFTIFLEVELSSSGGKQQHNLRKPFTSLLFTCFHPPHRRGEAVVTLWGWALVQFGSVISWGVKLLS